MEQTNTRGKQKWRRGIGVVVFVLGMAGFAGLLTRSKEPRYQGKPASEWLWEDEDYHREKAFRAMGEPGIEWLVKEARRKDSRLKRAYLGVVGRMAARDLLPTGAERVVPIVWPAAVHRMLAAGALGQVNADNEEAAEALLMLVHEDEPAAKSAFSGLFHMHREHGILARMTNYPNAEVRATAVKTLERVERILEGGETLNRKWWGYSRNTQARNSAERECRHLDCRRAQGFAERVESSLSLRR